MTDSKENEAADAGANDAPDPGGNDAPDPGGNDAPATGGDSTLSLEERLKRLEEIVRSLEAADLDMEGALTLFEEGVEHVRGAEATLRIAELKVEELLGPEEDSVVQPLEEEAE